MTDEEEAKIDDLDDGRTVADGETVTENELRRDLKPHQVFMFAIACSIGTGLVIGSGTALAKGGPGSAFIAYILVATALFAVMMSMGEMAAFLPMDKGFSGYATRMVGPAFGFATGWNYFFKYVIALPTNLTAAGLVIQYWRPDLSVAIWITVFGAAVITVNLLHVKSLGETEFWLGLAKVLVMLVMILTCFIIAMGGGPNHERTGFLYWKDPGAFASHLAEGATGRFLGWWACMCQACFAFTGAEVVGMTFGETPKPRKNIPRAVRQTFWRITVFYILGILVLGIAVPHDNEKLIGATKKSTSGAASPFVVAVSLAGIEVFSDIINGCLLVFTLSAAMTDIYCASRSLYGLAKDGQAPRIFAKARENGNPTFAVVGASLFVALAYMNASKSAATVFQYLVSLVTVFAVLNWVAILASYLAFRRALSAQGIPLEDLPYVGTLQPYGAYYALLVSLLVIIFNGYDAFIPGFEAKTLVLKYVGTILFLANILCWKVFRGSKFIKPEEVDLVTGRREFEERETAQDNRWDGSFWKELFTKFTR